MSRFYGSVCMLVQPATISPVNHGSAQRCLLPLYFMYFIMRVTRNRGTYHTQQPCLCHYVLRHNHG